MRTGDPPNIDTATISPIAERALRNAARAGIDPHRVAVALGIDPLLLDRVVTRQAQPAAPSI
jgi:hypothetical protein